MHFEDDLQTATGFMSASGMRIESSDHNLVFRLCWKLSCAEFGGEIWKVMGAPVFNFARHPPSEVWLRHSEYRPRVSIH